VKNRENNCLLTGYQDYLTAANDSYYEKKLYSYMCFLSLSGRETLIRVRTLNFTPRKNYCKIKRQYQCKVSLYQQGVGTTTENIKLLGIEKKVVKSTVMFTQQSVEKAPCGNNPASKTVD
jgi:hypothetical protein